MMRRTSSVLALLAALTVTRPAWAQAPTSPGAAGTSATNRPIVNLWYVGGAVGVGIVDKVGVSGNVEAGVRVWKNLDLLLEGGYAGNLVTRRELDRAGDIGNILATAQSAPVSTNVRVPSSYAAIGARWVFESNGRYRPYVLLSVGGASIDIKPSFVLNGADVTGSLGNFGITLGSDLHGSYRPMAVGGGVGVLVPLGTRWYADGSIRILSVNTEAQRTNLSRITVGVGRRF
jgi:hypothetical protein